MLPLSTLRIVYTMRMKYTMPPYPNTHVYFYNGRAKIIKDGRDEFVEFDETKYRSWERQLWMEGFRPLDEEGNMIMTQSPKSAPMRNLPTNDDNADIDHKESIDPGVLAANSSEFQEIHADELKAQEEAAAEADRATKEAAANPVGVAEGDENNTVISAQGADTEGRTTADLETKVESPVDVDPTQNAPAFGLTPEEAEAHEESNSGDPESKPASGAASVEEAPILAVEEANDESEDEDKSDDDDDKPSKRGRRRSKSKE